MSSVVCGMCSSSVLLSVMVLCVCGWLLNNVILLNYVMGFVIVSSVFLLCGLIVFIVSELVSIVYSLYGGLLCWNSVWLDGRWCSVVWVIRLVCSVGGSLVNYGFVLICGRYGVSEEGMGM